MVSDDVQRGPPGYPFDVVHEVVFPLVSRGTDPNGPPMDEVLGTAFLMQGRVLTAWHCLRDVVERGEPVGVMVRNPDSAHSFFKEVEFVCDPRGHDIAVGNISWPVTTQLLPAEPPFTIGQDVMTFSYPLPAYGIDAATGWKYAEVPRRYLRGYLVWGGAMEFPSGKAFGQEVDMLVPPGSSGAPLLHRETFHVIGMVVGDNTTTMDGRDTTFGLAYDIREVLVTLDQTD